MNLNAVKSIAGNAQLVLKKHSPEILIFGGIVGMVGATILACKETTKLEETVKKGTDEIEKVKENKESENYKRDLTFAYVHHGARVIRLYSPAILMGGASISAILGGHSILKKRNLAMAAAYSAIDEGFKKYRQRVAEEFGEEVDRRMRFGGKDESVQVVEADEEGKEKKKKVKAVTYSDCSDYARFFDCGSIKWTKNADANLFTLKQLERYANECLEARGHLFLNEVYDMLDIPRTRAGSVVGWILADGNQNHVSFGIYDINDEAKRRFVNGLEENILLDFNVDGMIYDKI